MLKEEAITAINEDLEMISNSIINAFRPAGMNLELKKETIEEDSNFVKIIYSLRLKRFLRRSKNFLTIHVHIKNKETKEDTWEINPLGPILCYHNLDYGTQIYE